MQKILIIFLFSSFILGKNLEEFLIDNTLIYGPAPDNQSSPAIAFDGVNYFIVWTDNRSGSLDIFGSRVSQNGVILDTSGIPISTAIYDQSSPQIAFDGNNYFVVWEDHRNSVSAIYGARVTPEGRVLDQEGICISRNNGWHTRPIITFGENTYLVVWIRNFDEIFCARVNRNGVVLDTNGIPISPISEVQSEPAVVFGENFFFVVWVDLREDCPPVRIYGARIDQSGIVLDTIGFPISTPDYYLSSPKISFDGENYLVVWIKEGDLYGVRVNKNGQVLDTTEIPISINPNSQASPAVAFDGTNYLTTWQENGHIYGSRISPNGIVIDTAGFIISSIANSSNPSLVFDGRNYFVTWQDTADIYGSRITPQGNVIDSNGICLSLGVNKQLSPTVAFDGANYLVVWQDYRKGIPNIYGIRIDEEGTVLDSEVIEISTGFNEKSFPAVTFGRTNYLVVWQEKRNNSYDIYGTRINQEGVVLDPEGIPISSAPNWQQLPAVSFDGNNFFVVWQDYRNFHLTNFSDIYGARVSQNGIILDTNGIIISPWALSQYSPSLVFDGINYLVVWEQQRYASYECDICGTRVTRSGDILEPNSFPISTIGNYQNKPAVSFDGNNFLVVWQDGRNGSTDIYGARVSRNADLLDSCGIPISCNENSLYYPSLTFDGTNYLVVWEEHRLSTNESDIYGARINPQGLVIDSFPISLQSGNQLSPKLTKGNNNQILIVYAGWIDSINHKPAFTYRIFGKFYQFTSIKENKNLIILSSLPFKIYPNPANSYFDISLPENVDRLKIYDISGRLVKNIKISNKRNSLPLSDIKTGIYFVRVGNLQGKLIIRK